MSTAETIRRYSLDDYLAMEPEGEVRHEYIDGELFAMVGSSYAHNVIVMNVGAALHRRFARNTLSGDCQRPESTDR